MVTNRQREDFSARLNSVLDEVGFAPKGSGRQVQLGKLFNVTQKGARKWLEGEAIPGMGRLEQIGRRFDVRVEWLLTGRGPKSARNEPPTVEPGPELRGIHPLISWVQAGRWCEIMDNFSPGDAEEWIPCPVSCGAQTFVLRVVGVSMEPKFREGELVFVDPSRQAENGSFVVVRLDDRQEATFKQYIQEGGRQYLKALNPAWPDPIIEVTEQATICGVVVFKGEQL